jgi:choline dehydrogenase-like flavoprotein
MQRLYLDRATTSSRYLSVAILAGACLGGGTAVNWQTSLRLPDPIRDEWAAVSGLPLFADETFSRALDAVSVRSHVGVDESVVNGNNSALRRGAQSLGWSWRLLPRNAKDCDPTQCGACVFGCRHGGKQATSITFLADAQQDGDVTIVPNCRVLRVMQDRGRATGVRAVARDADSSMGTEYNVEVRARIVVVAAGGIESPALLLRSGLTHSALGRNLYLHPVSGVAGRYAEPVRPWEGPPQTIFCDEHASLDGAYGVRLEVAPVHPGLLALALPWFGARDHRQRMQQAAHVSTMIALTRDSEGGRVRVRREGRAAIDYRIGARELSHMNRGIAAMVRAHVAAGAEEVITLHSRPHVLAAKNASPRAVDEFCTQAAASAVDRNWSTLFSAHQMGTCRMGGDPRTSVCDERGAVRGIEGLFVADASLFPASSGVNPMITVMAMAKVVGEAIARSDVRR